MPNSILLPLQGRIALVTGANRGLGLAFAQAALVAGARKVYAAARGPASVTLPRLLGRSRQTWVE